MVLSKEAEISQIPPAPPPPPPPPMDLAPKGEPKKGAPKKDLLAQIREGAVKKKVSLNHQDYNHVSTVPSIEKVGGLAGALQKQMGKSKETPIEERLLKGASKKEQENILYSAIVDKNEKLVESLLSHKSDVKVGVRDDDDGWEVDVIESRSTFSDKQVEAIKQAAEETRVRVEAGIDLVLPQKELEAVVKVKASSPPPISELGSSVSPPPSPPPPIEVIKDVAPKQVAKEVSVKKDIGGMLAQIRGKVKLNSVASAQSLNSGEFTYTASKALPELSVMQKAMQERRGAIAGKGELEGEITKELKKLSEKEQLNKLYSAVIDGDKTKIGVIVKVGDHEVFTKSNMEKIANAAQQVSKGQGSAKKPIIESGLKVLAEKAKIDLGVGEGRSR